MKTFYLTIAVLVTHFFTFSQEIRDSWEGELDVNGTKIPLIIKIVSEENNLKATLDSPMQGAKDIPIDKTEFIDNTLSLTALSLGISYSGELIKDEIIGTFKQGTRELPLKLSRSSGEQKHTFNRPQTPKEPLGYPTEEVTFVNPIEKNTLAGTISLPKNAKDFPILVMITGSGSQNRDEELFGHKPFAVIADDFAKKGIATLRIDDRGVGGSTRGIDKPTTANFATDITAAVNYLVNKGYKNIGLLGHSEGGMIAPMVASTNNNVKFIISMAGPATKIEDLMLMQIEKGGLLAGENPEKVKLDVQVSKKIYDFIKEYKGDDLKKEIESIYLKELKQYPDSLLDKTNIEAVAKSDLKSFTSPWFVYFIKFNPEEYISKVQIPVLALNGSLDFQVDAKTNLNAFKTILQNNGNKKVETIELEALNHLFQEAKTGSFAEYAQIEQTISPKALDLMSAWILKQ